MKKRYLTIIMVIILAVLAGCSSDSDNPYSIFKNPIEGSDLSLDENWPSWYIYEDEMETGGTVMFYTSTEGQTLDFSYSKDKYRGRNAVYYSWDGSEVYSYGDQTRQSDWVGWGFIAAKSEDDYDRVSVNMSDSDYTKISFYAKGTATVRFEGNAGSSSSSVPNETSGDIVMTASWKLYSFNTSPGASVSDYFKVILKSPGNVIIDDIKYE